MLAYFLATIMALISLVLFLNSFISPKTHRQDDFLWSGLGLFYALILWICAGRFTGAILLGQVAGVAMMIAFIWENRQLRKVITAESDSNELLEGFSILSFVAQSIEKLSTRKKASEVKSPESVPSPETPEVIEAPTSPSEETKESPVSEVTSETVSEEQEEVTTEATEELSKEEISTAGEAENESDIVEDEMITTPEQEDVENIEEESEEDLLGSSLTKEAETKATSKPNLFSRLFGIFRKSEAQKQEISPPEPEREETIEEEDVPETLSEIEALDDEKLAEVEEFYQDESSSEELDLKTTATEVEEAIENLELSGNLDEQSSQELTQNDLTETTASQAEEETEPEIDRETGEMDESEVVKTTPVEENLAETSEEEGEEEKEPEEISTIPESKAEEEVAQETEVSQSESETSTTPDEDDIIESLSDLFPQPNEVASESKSSPDTLDEDSETDDQRDR